MFSFCLFCKKGKDYVDKENLTLQKKHTTSKIIEILKNHDTTGMQSHLNNYYGFYVDDWYFSFDDNRPVRKEDFLNEDINESPLSFIFDSKVIKNKFGKSFPGITSFSEAFSNSGTEITDFYKKGGEGYIGITYGSYIYSIELDCDKNENCKIKRFSIGRK